MQVFLASPRGFCAGVEYAIEIVERELHQFGGNDLYVRHEIVHNKVVVDRLRGMGAKFVDEIDEIPEDEEDARVIYSAHGVSPQVREESRRRKLVEIDATCPLVTKVHVEARRFAAEAYEILLIGHEGHVEVDGIIGEAPDNIALVQSLDEARYVAVQNPSRVAYLTQTTLSVDDSGAIVACLKSRFPGIRGPKGDDICFATQYRQDAVKKLAERVDLILVVGDPNSSNSNRLVEVARATGCIAVLLQHGDQVEDALKRSARALGQAVDAVGLTAGASVPDTSVTEVLNRILDLGGELAGEVVTAREEIRFKLPTRLRE